MPERLELGLAQELASLWSRRWRILRSSAPYAEPVIRERRFILTDSWRKPLFSLLLLRHHRKLRLELKLELNLKRDQYQEEEEGH